MTWQYWLRLSYSLWLRLRYATLFGLGRSAAPHKQVTMMSGRSRQCECHQGVALLLLFYMCMPAGGHNYKLFAI